MISRWAFFHSFGLLVFSVCAQEWWNKVIEANTGEKTKLRKVTETTKTMSYSLDLWVNSYLQTQ